MSQSAESARLTPDQKIEFSCSCGKKYRVAARKAGKRVRCKGCRLKITVPGEAPAISIRTRKAILAEFGIDAEAAEQRYEEQQKTGYVCGRCAAAIPEVALAEAYGEEGLVCSSCRAGDVEERQLGDGSDEGKKKKDKRLQTWSRQGSVEDAKKKAYAMGALFFFGFAGFIHSIWGPTLLLTIPIAAAVAAAGAQAVFKAYEPAPEKPKKKV